MSKGARENAQPGGQGCTGLQGVRQLRRVSANQHTPRAPALSSIHLTRLPAQGVAEQEAARPRQQHRGGHHAGGDALLAVVNRDAAHAAPQQLQRLRLCGLRNEWQGPAGGFLLRI